MATFTVEGTLFSLEMGRKIATVTGTIFLRKHQPGVNAGNGMEL